MRPASYSFWAARILRDGAKPRRVEALCCNVLVVNGALADLSSTFTFLSFTNQDLSSDESTSFLRSTFFTSKISFENASNSNFLSCKNLPSSTKYSTGMKASISRSLSQIIRSAGDCTRPAERP